MLVQFVLKGLFLYFIFLVFRSLLRGVSQVNQMKDFMKESGNHQYQAKQGNTQAKAQSKEDIVEAEFRRL